MTKDNELESALKRVEALEEKLTKSDDLEAQLEIATARIAELEDRLEDAEDLVDDATELADCCEDELNEFLLPSSRRPPPHFKLPDERMSETHHFQIGNSSLGEGYLTTGFYPDSNEVGEIFIKMAKHADDPPPKDFDPELLMLRISELQNTVSELSAFLRGILDQLMISVSIGLQRGIPLTTYAEKFYGTRFPPFGFTRHPDISQATSILDYIFRYLGMKYIKTDRWIPPKRG